MNEHLPELTGFLCRWLLLAVTTLTACGGVWASISATAELVRGPSTDVVFSDGIGETHLRGFVSSPNRQRGRQPRLIAGAPGAGKVLTLKKNYIAIPKGALAMGLNQIDAWGVPYSSLAYEKTRMTIVNAAAETRAFIVEMQIVHDALADSDQTVRSILAEMTRRGRVLLVHAGPIERFKQLHADLLAAGVHLPTIFRPETTSSRTMVWLTTSSLRRQNKAIHLTLLTADAELASYAMSRKIKIKTYLLAGPDQSLQPRGGLSVHPSLKHLLAAISADPTPI